MGQSFARARTVLRHAIPVAIGVACCLALYKQLQHIEFSVLWASVMAVKPWEWALALTATAASFWAVARYDVVAHRHFQTGQSSKRATLTGATAISIGQTVGAGAVVGAFIRWRMQPNISLVMAAKLTAFVTLTFLTSWALITSIALLALPHGNIPTSIPLGVLLLSSFFIGASFFYPVLRRAGKEFEMPTIPAVGALISLCLMDVVAACIAFWALMPAGLDVSLVQLLPVYLVALGAAILSGTPGGVGPFELTVLAMLPFAPEAELMAAILAFRIVYYAIPLVIGGMTFLRPLAEPTKANWLSQTLGDLDTALTSGNGRAELGVVRQNGGAILHTTGGVCGVVRTGQTLTTIFDPVVGCSAELAGPLRKLAREQNRIVCKYKITARHAMRARKAGWTVIHIADEAMVDVPGYSLKGSRYRQLRRKLRTAEKSDVIVQDSADLLPFSDMARVSAAWEEANGAAKGLSMGQFEENYISHQRVFLAWKSNELVGFVTFHAHENEWCLDLMRVLPEAPDGTMHSLVNQAILAAKEAEVPMVSLAAAPSKPEGRNWIERSLRKAYFDRAGGPGLTQFKQCFKPDWKPLYMAAPSTSQLALAAMDLVRSVHLAKPKPAHALQAAPIPAE